MKEARVARVRRLLADAMTPDFEMLKRRQGPWGTIRRRLLIQEAKLLAARYGLREHMEAQIYVAGREALTGMDLDQLEQLVADLERRGAALDAACDPPEAPPAR